MADLQSDEERLAAIKAKITDRHRELKQTLLQVVDLRAVNDSKMVMYVRVIHGIAHQTFTAYQQLWDAAAEKNALYVAYNTRNLLELTVWSEYCCSSVENATRLSEDVRRDLAGMLYSIQTLVNHTKDTSAEKDIKELISNHAERAKAMGMPVQDDKYLTVAAAAKQLGPDMEAFYKTTNKVLSKVVHPTAFVVGGSGFKQWSEFAEEFTRQIFPMGIDFINTIERRITQWAEEMLRIDDYIKD